MQGMSTELDPDLHEQEREAAAARPPALERYQMPDPAPIPPLLAQPSTVTYLRDGKITTDAPSALLRAAELWLSLLHVVRCDAAGLASADPAAEATGKVHPDERGMTPEQLVGTSGLALIREHWDHISPLREAAPSRSLAHCEGCGEFWYIPGGSTGAPKSCSMTIGCPGPVHKAHARYTPAEQKRRRASGRTGGRRSA